MGKVDGLIIPRSYNDYFSRSNPSAVRQLVAQWVDPALSSTSELPVQNKVVKGALDDIHALIPAQASDQNQLADKSFVNSSVATNTANYISDDGDPFTSVADLEAYSGTVTNNDYAFVTGTDSAGNTYYDRYKATVSGSTVTWAKEYRLNNSSFTSEQWAAITSGISAAKVAQYDAAISVSSSNVLVCATPAGTATKAITALGFAFSTGMVIRVLFENANSEANPELQVNSETPVAIKALQNGTKIAPPVHNHKWRGASSASNETWQPYTQLELMYDGTDFVIMGNPVVEDGDDYLIYADGKVGGGDVADVKPRMATNAPYGWLLCNGQSVLRASYPKLFEYFNTQKYDGTNTLLSRFGYADSTHFNMPDLRETSLKGAGLTSKSSVHYDSDGLTLGEFIDDRIQTHKHEDSGHDHPIGYTPTGLAGGPYAMNLLGGTSLGNTNPGKAKLGAPVQIGTSAIRIGETTEVKATGVNFFIKAM